MSEFRHKVISLLIGVLMAAGAAGVAMADPHQLANILATTNNPSDDDSPIEDDD